MTAASDKDLGALHRVVANGLKAVIVDGQGKDEDGNPIPAAPAFYAAAIAFLKNNNITATLSGNEELTKLGEALKARRTKRVNPQALEAAAEEYALRHTLQ